MFVGGFSVGTDYPEPETRSEYYLHGKIEELYNKIQEEKSKREGKRIYNDPTGKYESDYIQCKSF